MKENEEVLNASKVRQEFTSNVSHELKTPLHVISGYAELIKDDIDRDSAMTHDSNFDIAFIREGKVNSGTEQNIMRRIMFK